MLDLMSAFWNQPVSLPSQTFRVMWPIIHVWKSMIRKAMISNILWTQHLAQPLAYLMNRTIGQMEKLRNRGRDVT